MGGYRWRTWLRMRLPARPPLYLLVPRGRRDCGDHEWYLVEPGLWRCVHCKVGQTRESPWAPLEAAEIHLAGLASRLELVAAQASTPEALEQQRELAAEIDRVAREAAAIAREDPRQLDLVALARAPRPRMG